MDLEEPRSLRPTEAYWQTLLDQADEADNLRAANGAAGPPPLSTSSASPTASGTPNGHDSGTQRDEVWAKLEAWHEEGVTFTAPVIGCNKGGLLVRVCDNIGFVPASQLAELPCTIGTADLRSDLEGMVGNELSLRLIEIDRSRNRVICSERATQWEDGDIDERLTLLESQIGSAVEGEVRSLCDFGAFVDLGGIDGLIHISELSWQRVDHPSDVLEVNDSVRVVILNVDRESRRVGLSRKRLKPDPWKLVGEHYEVGNVIDAEITNVVNFGAFARIEEGVEGLIHISELSDGPFLHPSHVVHEGQQVEARILHIDPGARRLGLSLRRI